MLTVRQRYRRTDRQTDGRTTYDSNTALALRASRGKNKLIYIKQILEDISVPSSLCGYYQLCTSRWLQLRMVFNPEWGE